jgi:hypothetical protein
VGKIDVELTVEEFGSRQGESLHSSLYTLPTFSLDSNFGQNLSSVQNLGHSHYTQPEPNYNIPTSYNLYPSAPELDTPLSSVNPEVVQYISSDINYQRREERYMQRLYKLELRYGLYQKPNWGQLPDKLVQNIMSYCRKSYILAYLTSFRIFRSASLQFGEQVLVRNQQK